MTESTPKAGDKVQFVNGGSVTPAVVLHNRGDGTLDLSYGGGADYPAIVWAGCIPFCLPGGSHGWQPLVAEVEAEAPAAVDVAAEVPAEAATESPAEG